MDLAIIAVICVAISLPLVIWDVVTSLSARGSAYIQPYMQAAYLVLFVAGFYLLVSRNILNFSAVLLIATAVTGALWLWDVVARKKPAATAAETARAPSAPMPSEHRQQEPTWLELAKSFFPVILIVFLLRSFLVEPFKIPSGSMIPTLLVGDFILVNKFTYGIRLPVINKKIIEVNQPKRGEVMVFRYPENPSLDYIKRIVGVPGDTIAYRGKRLEVNGAPVETSPAGDYPVLETGLSLQKFSLFTEKLGESNHVMMVDPDIPPVILSSVRQFSHRENCRYNDEGFSCTVPPGHYFMMGDNRDSSSDSRYWGFVPEDHIVGKAFFIWFNFGEFGRIGKSIH
jgi:signal peptidase I